MRTSSASAIASRVVSRSGDIGRPAVVGISGFGGAGKSTLAVTLSEQLPGSNLVPGDEFMRARPCAIRSDDWSSIDRERLLQQVLLPVQQGRDTRYQIYDWESEALGAWVSIRGSDPVIVEGVGLFHPELRSYFDLRVWIDVDLETATAQGIRRDTVVHNNPQTELWELVWKPNDGDFFNRFRPDQTADILFAP